jgi:hypothetical protein
MPRYSEQWLPIKVTYQGWAAVSIWGDGWNYFDVADRVCILTKFLSTWFRVPYPSRLQKVQNASGTHFASWSVGDEALSRAVKRPDGHVSPSPPSCAEVKNEWSHTFSPHTRSWCEQGHIYLYL